MRDARAGERVLAISTDQAHSLGDVLGVAVPPTGARNPVRVFTDDLDAGGGLLDALALDTLALLESRWREIATPLAAQFPESELGDVAPEELSALPGIQEVLGSPRSPSWPTPGSGITSSSTARRPRMHCAC